MYGRVYICNHPVYDRCTLYEINNKGLAVIQQRFDNDTKCTYWTEIDEWLTDPLYLIKILRNTLMNALENVRTDYILQLVFDKLCGR